MGLSFHSTGLSNAGHWGIAVSGPNEPVKRDKIINKMNQIGEMKERPPSTPC